MENNPQDPRVVETASATTSPDNSNSGPFAYIITGVVIGLLLLFSFGIAGCTSLILNTVVKDQYENGYSSNETTWDFDDYEDLDYENMDYEDWLEFYENEIYGTDSSHGDDAATVEDVLDYSIAPYGSCIESELSASAYAGAKSDVRDYVRAFVSADEEKTNHLVSLLNEAALDEDVRSERIEEAVAFCDETKAFFESYDLPTFEGDDKGVVRDLLGSAKGSAAARWENFGEELKLLTTTDEVDTTKLWNYDAEAETATEEAAEYIADAMETSAS